MDTDILDLWKVIIIPLFICFIATCVQFFLGVKTLRQVRKLTEKDLLIKHLTTERSAATFIADKRQKWIDVLRDDIASHLASSMEISWKWDSGRSKTAIKTQLKGAELTPQELQDAADELSIVIGSLDREHHERHIRIKLQLNPGESDHIALHEYLNAIRINLQKTQCAENLAEANKLIDEMKLLLANTEAQTQKILKDEWTRLKREVSTAITT